MRARSQRIFEAVPSGTQLDAIVILNGSANFVDKTFRYVSAAVGGGFEGCSAVLRPDDKPQLLVPSMEEESARTAPDCEVLAFQSKAAHRELLKTTLGDAKRIGLHAGGAVWARVKDLLEIVPGVELEDVTDAITAARLIKDDREQDLIREACRITSEVAAEIPSMLREGMTEKELGTEIELAMQRRGGTAAFSTIVCFGKNGSQPHYTPGDAKLTRGDMILTDFGAKRADYCADITRMYLFGEASTEQRRMFDVVREAQAAALEMTTAGTVARDVHRKAAEIIDGTEFAGRFIHGLGHSIGLDVHDGGGMNDASELRLEPGMVFTIEPGVYVPEVGGVRIEDTVVVTDGAPEILTPVTKDLVEVSG